MPNEAVQEVTETLEELTDVEKQEQDDVAALWKEYEEARIFDAEAYNQFGIDRSYASGKKKKNWASDANLIGTFIDILVSFLYARDPDVSARAAKTVGQTSSDSVKFAETAGILVPRVWKKARLKRAARKQVRSAMTVGAGWFKAIMLDETKVDPLVQRELNDLQANLEDLQFTATQLEEGDNDLEETNALIAKRERLRDSLQSKLEVVYYKGMAIDYVLADDVQVSLDVSCIADYLDADWMGHQLFIRENELRKKFPDIKREAAQKATVYHQRKPTIKRTTDTHQVSLDPAEVSSLYQKADSGKSTGKEVGFVRVVEICDNRDGHIKTMVEGVKQWARQPYEPAYPTSRFYPYFGLFLFETDGDRFPQSLPQRLDKLQDEYSSKRSNSRLHAERSVGATLFDSQAISDDDAKKIVEAQAQEFIPIKHVKGDDLRKAFAAKPVANVDPLVFDTSAVVRDMERVSGVQEALSGSIKTAKTATEAKIEDQGFNARSSSDRDTLEDMLQDFAEYTLELAVSAVPYEEAVRLAGAEAFWPEGMSHEDILTMADIDIKAGTTGKPNEEAERNSWSILLPLIQTIMQMVQQNQIMGNLPMAEALVNLLEETLRRLDERIDVQQFIPQGLPNLAGVPVPPVAGDGPPASKEPAQTSADANTLV